VLANYTLYRLDRNCPGGGVLIAILNKYTSIACPQYATADIELLWIQIHNGIKPVILGVFYHFPGSLPLFNPSDCPQSQREFVALCGMMGVPRVEMPNCLGTIYISYS